MAFRWNPREHARLGGYVIKWLLIGIPVGVVVGAAVALFLWALEEATKLRWSTDLGIGVPWLLFLLPVAGIGISWMYAWVGKSAEGGNNLIIDQIHNPGGGVPKRMAPLVLIGTVVTHLFGGSAGREGTAIQMGGSIASGLGRLFGLRPVDTRAILAAGVAAGFGAVFGTPLTGAVFAMEVLALGIIRFEFLMPCLIASVAGNWTTLALGIHHTHFFIGNVGQMSILADATQLSWPLLGKVAIAAVAFGLGSVVFAEMAHGLQAAFKKIVPWPSLRPALGGLIVIALAFWIGADYLGLGVSADPNHPGQVSILSSFQAGGAATWSWLWKTIFTTVTLSSGFKGGEVTPLFFIGAALGNTMAVLLQAPVGLFAGLGFVAVFAGATNTPLACTIMGIELFGAQPELMHSGFVVYVATACFLAYMISGHSGIYLSQRIGVPKCVSPSLPPDASLRVARSLQPAVGLGMGSWPASVRRAKPSSGHGGEKSQVSTGADAAQGGAPAKKEQVMAQRYKVSGKEIGLVRIYMTPSDRRETGAIKRFFSKPLYQEIIQAAKTEGILNAVAHHTRYGYSGDGKIEADRLELPNDRLQLYVELISPRKHLERFCCRYGELLQGKIVVYKHIEHWEVDGLNTLVESEATVEELAGVGESA